MLSFAVKRGPATFSVLSLYLSYRLAPCHCAVAFRPPSTMVQTRRGGVRSLAAVKDGDPADESPVKARRYATKAVAAAATADRPPRKSASATNKKKKKGLTDSPAKTSKSPPAHSRMIGERRLLFSLRDDDELLEASLVCRPSKRNKSPYVGDIRFGEGDKPPYPLVHLPNLDMGGKCRPGVRLLVKPSRDRNGNKISPDATGKFGTPKCQYICQVLLVDESAYGQVEETTVDDGKTDSTAPSSPDTLYPRVWVGAHPSLGERIAEVWLREGLIEGIPPVTHLQRQITHPAGADMRADFCVHHEDGSRRIVEIKTVVDADYAVTHPPRHDGVKCVFTSAQTPYQRTAIFPWGSSNQKGPDGEKVVSARAIHHVGELAKLSQGELLENDTQEGWDGTYHTTLIFVVIRGDAQAFRPNREACPSFAKYLAQARDQGVQILAKRVSWGMAENEMGCCYDDKMLPIQWESS